MTSALIPIVDVDALVEAKARLERSSIADKLTSLIGTPLERGFAALPPAITTRVNAITRKALMAALRVAITTLGPGQRRPLPLAHKLAVTAAGAAGGMFGLASLAIELPFSTTLMLRSIADIARAEGEDLSTPEARLACLEVFALGGQSETGRSLAYFGMRDALAKQMAGALSVLAQQGVAGETPAAVVRFISSIAARFQVPITQKLAAEALPLVGAAGGAVVNYLFIDHFQDLARGHFTVRRLERKYGPAVREVYEGL